MGNVSICGIAVFRRGSFGVDNPAARRHPVDVAGFDDLYGSQTVPMNAAPFKKVRHSGQSDVGMRSDVDSLLFINQHRAHVI